MVPRTEVASMPGNEEPLTLIDRAVPSLVASRFVCTHLSFWLIEELDLLRYETSADLHSHG